MARKSRIEIVADILKTVDSGESKPTRIMYKCNLSWPRLMKYLELLVEWELIEDDEVESKTIYRITNKGHDIALYFKNIDEDYLRKSPFVIIPLRRSNNSETRGKGRGVRVDIG